MGGQFGPPRGPGDCSENSVGIWKMPLYAASSEWEYMTVPEQSGKRLGNQFYFNRYGMRCQEWTPPRNTCWGSATP